MATELLKNGTRVRLPRHMREWQTRRGEPLIGTIRGIDDRGMHYAVEFDKGTMGVGHQCSRYDGTYMTASGRGWWFDIVPLHPEDALVPIETSKFESAVADYIAREIGG